MFTFPAILSHHRVARQRFVFNFVAFCGKGIKNWLLTLCSIKWQSCNFSLVMMSCDITNCNSTLNWFDCVKLTFARKFYKFAAKLKNCSNYSGNYIVNCIKMTAKWVNRRLWPGNVLLLLFIIISNIKPSPKDELHFDLFTPVLILCLQPLFWY